MVDMQSLEIMRTEMIDAFKAYSNMYPERLQLRSHLWTDYCLKRESFLKADCERRKLQYLPLHMTLKDPSDHYN